MKLADSQARQIEQLREARMRSELAQKDVRSTALDLIAGGLSRSATAEAAGVTRMTLHRWLEAADPVPVPKEPGNKPPTKETSRMSQDPHPLDKQTAHTETEAYLVVSQLNYRAGVTRHGPPALSKLRELHGDISNERARFIMDQTDRRIRQAAARHLEESW